MPSATLTSHGLTHLVDSNWLSNMPYHQNAVLHSYTHTLGLHNAPDKCSLQWNKHGYYLPYKIFIPDILWLNWSCLCCTPLMHHMRYIRLKWTRTGWCSEDTTPYMHKTEFAIFCTKLNYKCREFLCLIPKQADAWGNVYRRTYIKDPCSCEKGIHFHN
jgi:hypothetical protein